MIITFLFLEVNIPGILLAANVILFFCLTWNYHGGLFHRIFTSIFMFLILACLEAIIAHGTGLMDFSLVKESAFHSYSGLLIIKVVSYMAVLIMENFTSLRNGVKIPPIYWLCVVLIPVSTLYLLLVIFSMEAKIMHLLVSMTIILFLNFAIFYLYDHLAKVHEENTDKVLIKAQNRYYEKQLSMMKSSLDSVKALKHDMKNHFLSIESLAKIASEIAVPSQLEIKAFDLTTILGNLLDNAINGIMTIEEDRRIGVYVSGDLNELTIIVKNSFDGTLKKRGKQLITRQQNKINHGYGIENIKRSARKYDGIFEYESENDEFTASITLFSA